MTSFAVVLMFSPWVALICLGGFIVIVALTRYVSLGSMVCGFFFPILAFFFGEPWLLVAVGSLLALLIVLRHSANIQRLLAGDEKKLRFRKESSVKG